MTKKTDLLEGYLTKEEVAELRRLSLRTLRDERRNGYGPPFVRQGRGQGRILYPADGLHRWLRAHEHLSNNRPRKAA